jgi:hypothetical protein
MVDQLQLGIIAAVLIAFVFVGCLATRAPRKPPKAPPNSASRCIDLAQRPM